MVLILRQGQTCIRKQETFGPKASAGKEFHAISHKADQVHGSDQVNWLILWMKAEKRGRFSLKEPFQG
jgi:hypothetical protein